MYPRENRNLRIRSPRLNPTTDDLSRTLFLARKLLYHTQAPLTDARSVTMVRPDKEHELSLHGIVLASDWGDSGEARRVAIHAADEEVFEVAPDGVGRRLLQHLRQEVVVRALLGPDQGRHGAIEVLDFEVIESHEDTT